MFELLTRYLPGPAANVVMGLWYALLLCLVLFFLSMPQGVFRYIQI